jgi:hypothetical protein
MLATLNFQQTVALVCLVALIYAVWRIARYVD